MTVNVEWLDHPLARQALREWKGDDPADFLEVYRSVLERFEQALHGVRVSDAFPASGATTEPPCKALIDDPLPPNHKNRVWEVGRSVAMGLMSTAEAAEKFSISRGAVYTFVSRWRDQTDGRRRG
jgi:hypothetical protein